MIVEKLYVCRKVPICPYMRLPCRKFVLDNARVVCSGCDGRSEFVRCSWLPSWVPDGNSVLVLRGGCLRV